MTVAFSNSWILIFAIIGLIPLLRSSQTPLAYSWLAILPKDPLSSAMDWLERSITAVVIVALISAIAGPHLKEKSVQRIGTGAHIVLLLDRSASMNANFAGSYLGGGGRESKSTIATQLLSEFVGRRQKDLFAMVSFSTSPIYVLPLTQNHNAVQAAIRSSRTGKGQTNLGPALAMALDFFSEKKLTGARVIVLVSDGATVLKPEIQQHLTQLFRQNQVRLYWIYLRTQNAPSLDNAPKHPNERTTPEIFIHRFFETLRVPYQVFQAEGSGALKQAMMEIEKLENKPIRFLEKIPKQDLSFICYAIALISLIVLLLLKLMGIRKWAP